MHYRCTFECRFGSTTVGINLRKGINRRWTTEYANLVAQDLQYIAPHRLHEDTRLHRILKNNVICDLKYFGALEN